MKAVEAEESAALRRNREAVDARPDALAAGEVPAARGRDGAPRPSRAVPRAAGARTGPGGSAARRPAELIWDDRSSPIEVPPFVLTSSRGSGGRGGGSDG